MGGERLPPGASVTYDASDSYRRGVVQNRCYREVLIEAHRTSVAQNTRYFFNLRPNFGAPVQVQSIEAWLIDAAAGAELAETAHVQGFVLPRGALIRDTAAMDMYMIRPCTARFDYSATVFWAVETAGVVLQDGDGVGLAYYSEAALPDDVAVMVSFVFSALIEPITLRQAGPRPSNIDTSILFEAVSRTAFTSLTVRRDTWGLLNANVRTGATLID